MINMDKNKAYCPQCQKEMTFNKEKEIFEYNCNCYNDISRKRILLWCDECKSFTSRAGVTKNGRCARCIVKLQHKTMKENDPEGYAKRQSSASKKAHKIMKENNTGIYNQEVRNKIEETKKK